MNFDAILSALRAYWDHLGILNPTGATDTDIANFEARYGVTLPADSRSYFASLNGTRGGALSMDDEGLHGFWHLDQVRTFAEEGVGDQPWNQAAFTLADFSIWGY